MATRMVDLFLDSTVEGPVWCGEITISLRYVAHHLTLILFHDGAARVTDR